MLLRTVSVVLLLVGPPSASAIHTAALSRDEEACQRTLGPATDHFGAAIAACVVRCDKKAERGKVPASECVPPYGGATRACIARGDTAQRHRITRGCTRDCPECYQGGDCASYGDGAITVTGQVVDGLVRQVLCDDTDGISEPEHRCRRTTGAALAKAARAMGICFVRCRRDEERGTLAPQACELQPVPAATRSCLDGVKTAAARAIDRRCTDPPECLPKPAALVDTLETQITSDYQVLIFCASPSGAFVERR